MKLTCGVTIATRNRQEDLHRTCLVLAALDPQPDQVLICADGCDDGTSAMIHAEFPTFELIENETCIGSIPSRNKLIRALRCDIALSLDDDSYPIEQDFIEKVRALFSKHPALAVATFPQRSDEWPESLDETDFGESKFVGSYANCAAAIRRDVFIELGGYPDFFKHAYEEPDFALRCVEAGYEVRYETSLHARHHYSARERNEIRNHHFQARNELWSVFMRCPFPQLFAIAPFRGLRQLEYARDRGWPWIFREPKWWIAFLAGLPRALRQRRPIAWDVYKRWLHLVREPVACDEETHHLAAK